MGEPSSLQAVSDGIDHARRRVFPFDVNRWILLGFICFLEQCGRGNGGGFNFPNNIGGGPGGGSGNPLQWLRSHVVLVVALAAAAMLLIIAISALVIFISSRGIFMYIEAVGQGVVDIEGGWRRHAHLARSLFFWRFAVAIATLLLMFSVIAAGAVAIFGAAGSRAGPGGIFGVLLGFFAAFFALTLASGLVNLFLRDFVAPLQLAGQITCGAAVREAWRLVGGYPLTFAGYVLLKIPYTFLLMAVSILAGCATCCLGFLPLISQALLQPLHAFERSWSLCLLRQMGVDLTQDAPDATAGDLGGP